MFLNILKKNFFFILVFVLYVWALSYHVYIYIFLCLCWIIYYLIFYAKKWKNSSENNDFSYKYKNIVVRTPNSFFLQFLYLIYLYKPHIFANQIFWYLFNWRGLFKKSFLMSCYNIFIMIITGMSRIYLIFLIDFLEISNERIVHKKKFKLIFKNYMEKKFSEIAKIIDLLEATPHTNRIGYQPYNEISKEAVNSSFVEVYFWSIPYQVEWLFLKNPKIAYKNSYLDSFLKENDEIAFIYFSENNFLLVGYNKNLSLKNLLKKGFLEDEDQSTFIFNKKQIIEALHEFPWTEIDFNTHYFGWNITYQTVVGGFLDLLCGGLVDLLPAHWGDPYVSNRQKSANGQKSPILLERRVRVKEFQTIFTKWALEKKNSSVTMEFIDWYEDNYLHINL